jgi:predicted adenine nucleotide alpha hydrolase (AANH) superfamily ATPase
MNKKVWLHGCCADCTWKMVEAMKTEEMEPTVFYYNPNIHPRSEFQSRLGAIQKVAEMKGFNLVIADWRPSEYFKAIKGKKDKRCIWCWQLRLEKTAEEAKKRGYNYFSSTLLSSKYQDSDKIIKIGNQIAKKYGLELIVPKVIDRELETSGFYKQIFCGCVYSLAERMEEKYWNQ